MSVLAPTFPELVAEASQIVRARVTEVVSRKVPGPQGEVIKTFVTFEVTSALKAPERSDRITLEFLGGNVGDEGLVVPGMPSFEAGAEEFLFVTADKTICPLVGAMHGRYHVFTAQKDGRAYVARDDGSALVRVSDVTLPMAKGHAALTLPGGDSALTPESFEQLIAAEIARQTPASTQR